MIINDVLKIIDKMENEVLFDVEAPAHWYLIEYDWDNSNLVIYEIDEYSYNGDEWGEIIVKHNKTKIESIRLTNRMYTDFLIQFFKRKIEYIKYEYPTSYGNILKIDIKGDNSI